MMCISGIVSIVVSVHLSQSFLRLAKANGFLFVVDQTRRL